MGADTRLARAEQLRTIGGDRDQLERGQRIRQWHLHPGAAIAVERDLALPQQHRLEILAVEPREIAAATPAGLDRLLAVMPFAHDLRLRGRGEHRDRPIAHHRSEHVPAFIGRKLEQGLVDCGEGHIGFTRRRAVGVLHLHVDIRHIARGIGRLLGLDCDTEAMALPADLHLGDAEAVRRLGEIDRRSRLAAILRAGKPPVARQARSPVREARDTPAHRHHRDIDVRRIGRRHRHFDHRILAAQPDDEARQHALALHRHQRSRFAERHADLEFGGLAGLVFELFGDDVHPVAIVAAEPPIVVADQPGRARCPRDIAIGVLGRRNRIDFAGDARIELAGRQPLRVGRRRAGRAQLGRLHLVVIGVEAADQPAPRCQDLTAVELDRDGLVGDRFARGVERDEAQPQIVLLHQPAIGLDAELNRGGVDRNPPRRSQDLAIGVLIIHLDLHVGRLVEALRDLDGGPCGAVAA